MKPNPRHAIATHVARAAAVALTLLGAARAGAADETENYDAGTTGVGDVWTPAATNRGICISGIYPHLAVFNGAGECGIGAVAPWAGKLWFLTYPPHCTKGSPDKLYTVDAGLRLEIRPESVGGTHASRLFHRESNQLILGPYAIDAEGRVRAFDLKTLAGRMTATARHLTDPANKVLFYDMEGAVYEADVHTLAVHRLFEKPVPGWHGKGGYTAQGRFVLANNGEHPVGRKPGVFLATGGPASPEDRGVLAEWDGAAWRVLERRQFTEVTGPGGPYGSPDDRSPLWAMGWDRRSVILKLLDGGAWHTFRLPKASFTQEASGGFYTEWPRIREVTDGRLLAHMQCLFYDFPKTFSAADHGGLRPISTYTRMPVDYCAWQGRIAMARDDASIMQNALAGQSHSALWFGSWADLENLGAPAGWGGPWLDDDVRAGQASDPFLVNGFTEGVLHLRHDAGTPVEFAIEGDPAGRNAWKRLAVVTVPPHGSTHRILADELRNAWLRIVPDRDAPRARAFFRLGNPPRPAATDRFAGLASASGPEAAIEGAMKPASGDARRLLFAATRTEDGHVIARSAWTMDARLEFEPMNDPAKESILRTKYGVGPGPGFDLDASSVIVRQGGHRLRLPKTDAAYDAPFAGGWPRGLREVVTERSLLNAHGTFYEVPRSEAGGFARMRPICSHGRRITDFAPWRGMLVLAGVRADAEPDGHVRRSADGGAALWFGDVDDLWSLGAPVGTGGPWKDTPVKAGESSDAYLMAGYRTKSVSLAHGSSTPVTFTIEVDVAATGDWTPYTTLEVAAGAAVVHRFPAGYSAHWVRLKTDRDTTATAIFTYAP